jgi:hypothetical protein
MHVLPLAKRAEVVEHLMEGNGIRPHVALCGVDKNTCSSLLLAVARGANVAPQPPGARVSTSSTSRRDELHSFVKKRVKKHHARGPAGGRRAVGVDRVRAATK